MPQQSIVCPNLQPLGDSSTMLSQSPDQQMLWLWSMCTILLTNSSHVRWPNMLISKASKHFKVAATTHVPTCGNIWEVSNIIQSQPIVDWLPKYIGGNRWWWHHGDLKSGRAKATAFDATFTYPSHAKAHGSGCRHTRPWWMALSLLNQRWLEQWCKPLMPWSVVSGK